MCGIIGIISQDDVKSKLMKGLNQMTYRGYDSSGIAIFNQNKVQIYKKAGKLINLEKIVQKIDIQTKIGIGHCRWATTGEPTDNNSHPHQQGHVSLCHNGIIENYEIIKQILIQKGVIFHSETDTEVAAALINDIYEKNLKDNKIQNIELESILQASQQLNGSFAFAILFDTQPDKLYCICKSSPLCIGLSKSGSRYIASDSTVFSEDCENVCYLKDNIAVQIQFNQECILLEQEKTKQTKLQFIPIDKINQVVSKGNFDTYMLKEIYEQPECIAKTLSTTLQLLQNDKKLCECIQQSSFITIIACGTSYHASLFAAYFIEKYCRIRCKAELASEFLYRQPLIAGTYIFVSQSGETRDTVQCLNIIKEYNKNIKCISLINVINSQLARLSDFIIQTKCGPEIGVASTKAFTSQLTIFICIAIKFSVNKQESEKLLYEIQESVNYLEQQIQQIDPQCQNISKILSLQNNLLYIGRNICYSLVMEGSLKMKEISYIHSEAYAAGELKHGPIALIDENMWCIATSLQSDFEKTMSNIKEIQSRKGNIVLIYNDTIYQCDTYQIQDIKQEESNTSQEKTKSIIFKHHGKICDIFSIIISQQLLSYYTAINKKLDVDQPRNLAKCVTVE